MGKDVSRVKRSPPSSHGKEPSVTAHYEYYAHDEWSIGDLLHGQNYPSLPITFPCFESRELLHHMLISTTNDSLVWIEAK
jgi:hypothetical protein